MSQNDPQSQPTKIAYLVNQYPTISHTFIRTEIQALEKQGMDVTRISVRGWDAELADDDDRQERLITSYLLRDGLLPLILAFLQAAFTRPLGLFSATRVALKMARSSQRGLLIHLVYLAEACLLHKKMRQQQVRHVHCHFGTNATEVGMLCGALGVTTYSFTVHGPEEFDKAYELNLREKIKRCRFVVAISSFGRSQLYRFSREEDWSKIQIVHCGLGDGFLNNNATPPPAAPRFVSVGRFAEQKGQIVLIRACGLLAQRGIDFAMQVVGDGDMRPQIEQEIQALGLEKTVELVGWKSGPEIRKYLTDSQALVVPSFAEGLPVVIMEAMAIARPVITTYIAGIPELVRDNQEGLLVYASDAEGLADAMEEFLGWDREVIQAMGTRARDRVRKRHSGATEAAKLFKLFVDATDSQL